jgi:nucleoid DNA-binding protein
MELGHVLNHKNMSSKNSPTNTTKRDIVLAIYAKGDIAQKDVAFVVEETINLMKESLLNGKNLELRNFGSLKLVERKARPGRNPKKPEEAVLIPARTTVKFKPGTPFKKALAAATKSKK